MLIDSIHSELISLFQVVVIDLVLAGDNAIVVGLAAAGVPAPDRRRVICGGIALAVVLRILFAAVTTELLALIGLTLAGGLLLLWVCWKFYRDLRVQRQAKLGTAILEARTADGGTAEIEVETLPVKSVRAAVWHIALADISMSLDNVLAVAGAARDHMSALVLGLTLSVVLMGVGASLIARILQRQLWVGYLGLGLITYIALSMIWRGAGELAHIAAL